MPHNPVNTFVVGTKLTTNFDCTKQTNMAVNMKEIDEV